MKNSWNDMISLFPPQEFMSLTTVHGKLRASAPCSIFHVDSLRAALILHQVPPKLLRLSICIKLMALAHHSTGQPSAEFNFHIDSKCAFV
ncbi:hypothetical protein BHM03_00055467 [Ensete ventricosum]|nr:hypothetical protein BHM03_00055467 [Ensete ventricosum]